MDLKISIASSRKFTFKAPDLLQPGPSLWRRASWPHKLHWTCLQRLSINLPLSHCAILSRYSFYFSFPSMLRRWRGRRGEEGPVVTSLGKTGLFWARHLNAQSLVAPFNCESAGLHWILSPQEPTELIPQWVMTSETFCLPPSPLGSCVEPAVGAGAESFTWEQLSQTPLLAPENGKTLQLRNYSLAFAC